MRMQLETARLAATPRPFIRDQHSVDPFTVAVAPDLLQLDLLVAFAIVSADVTSLLLDYHWFSREGGDTAVDVAHVLNFCITGRRR